MPHEIRRNGGTRIRVPSRNSESTLPWSAALALAQLACATALAQLPHPGTPGVSPLPKPTAQGGAEIIYVDANANGFENGTSWDDAFKDLTDAIAAADTGDEIWVAMGTYRPTGPAGSRSISFHLINDVAIYGGFSGSETMREQRAPSIYLTTLSGDLNGDDGPGPFEDNTENSYHVVTAGSGVGATAILDGFTITAGNANGTLTNSNGGGLNIISAGPTIVNCEFLTNSCSSSGAAVYVNSGVGNTTFRSCLFNANGIGVGTGGALYIGTTSNVRVISSIFSNNSATSGGAIEMFSGSSVLSVTNSYFQGNSADTGGAIRAAAGTLNATNCEFSYNSTTGAGGGAISNIATFTTITNCTFGNNSCANFGRGGGIRHSNSVNSLTVNNSIFWGNTDFDGMVSSSQIHVVAGANDPTVSYSIVQGGWSGPGTNNLSSDPLFFDPPNFDYRVLSNSPAVDSGNNLAVPQDSLDIDQDSNTNEPTPLGLGGLGRFADNPYVTNTGNGTAPIVDRGAWEVRSLVYLYVDEDGLPGTGDWAAAYDNLQDALNESKVSAFAEIWVADGTYYPDLGNNVAPGDRTATFQLRDHVEIYGGFAGDETMREERDPLTNVSILSGDLDEDDGPNFLNYDDNSYHVVTSSGVDSSAILDGFTITGGNANGSSMDAFGGGIYNDGGTPSISQITVSWNRADTAGGGMYNTNGGNATLENITFFGNDATIAGGGMDSFASAVSLTDCDFIGNTATFAGAMNNTNSTPVCNNCEFSGNSASDAGGAVYNFGGSPEFRNCNFVDNTAIIDGGGMLNESSAPVVVDCIFMGNFTSTNGGGLSNVSGSNLQLFNSRFLDNSGDNGGGLHNTSSLLATNCVFAFNSGLTGGAVRTASSNPAFVNCTFVDNGAASTGGLHIDGGSVLVANSIFWDNNDKGGSSEDAQIRIEGGTLDIDYSIVDGLTGSFGGSGNISSDPMFVRPLDNDYRLQAGSPAIDSAHTPSVPSDSADVDDDANTSERVPLDANSGARFIDDPDTTNTGVPSFPVYPIVVDMGAFEFLGSDCNQNNIPDNCDISCGFANGPCDVPGCGMSIDLDSNSLPDECADFVGGCSSGMDENWSCFNNWFIPGDVYPDNSMSQSYDVLLDMTDDVFLDVDVTIDSLVIKDQAKLRMTQTGSAGDLIIATDKGLKLMGTGPDITQLLTAGNRMITLLCGPVTVLNAFYGPSPTAPPGSVNSILNCETLRVTQPSGEVRLEDSMSINASVDLIVDGRGATPCTSDGGKTTPIKRVFDNSSVNIGGDFSLQDNTNFTNASAMNMNVGGSFFNSGQIGDCFDCSQGGITLMGVGTQTFEVSGEDLGASMNGFVHPMGHTNFSWQDIEVTGGTGHVVRFENGYYNGFGFDPCTEALYVRNLTLQAGSTITIEDVKVYYLNLVNNGGTINNVGCGQLVPVQIACTMNQQCDDSAACTFDDCHMGFCRFTEVEYGNVNGMGPPNPNLDDILCVLAGFANINNCTNGDIRGVGDAACVPNNVISLDDILAVLGAFSGVDLCGCVP